MTYDGVTVTAPVTARICVSLGTQTKTCSPNDNLTPGGDYNLPPQTFAGGGTAGASMEFLFGNYDEKGTGQGTAPGCMWMPGCSFAPHY